MQLASSEVEWHTDIPCLVNRARVPLSLYTIEQRQTVPILNSINWNENSLHFTIDNHAALSLPSLQVYLSNLSPFQLSRAWNNLIEKENS